MATTSRSIDHRSENIVFVFIIRGGRGDDNRSADGCGP